MPKRFAARILEREPKHFGALHALGAICSRRGEFAEAEQFIGQALKVDGRSALAWNGHGSALRGLKRFDDALLSYRRAIALKPDFAQAFYNLSGVMHDLGQLEEALAYCDKALAIDPYYVRALYNRGGLLQELGRLNEALETYDGVIARDPRNTDAFNSRGILLMKLGRLEDALTSFDRATLLDPDHQQAWVLGLSTASQLCDWTDRDRRHAAVERLLESDQTVAPFPLLHEINSPAMHLKAARSVWRFYAANKPLTRKPHPVPDGRIRLTYISADFCDHPVAHAVVELFERHDREKFDVYAISIGPANDSPIRQRLETAVDRFIEAERKSDDEIAVELADMGVGIVVDLMGHTRDHRPGIFAKRPAPVAVNYLGYPGTSGGECIDYIIADRNVIPEDAQCYYSEKIAYLPHTYFVADSSREIAGTFSSRAAHGLPEDGFVFCSFGNPFKITPEQLTVWARILGRVRNSVLWLNVGNRTARQNLCREIEARGVSSSRLVFAPFEPSVSEHLARLRHADLFLDTMPYNGHSTACDALYAGVPVLTCMGRSFAARVGGSLLKALGLPRLITRSIEDYEMLAVRTRLRSGDAAQPSGNACRQSRDAAFVRYRQYTAPP